MQETYELFLNLKNGLHSKIDEINFIEVIEGLKDE